MTADPPHKQVAFIGLGAMGYPMAARVAAAGHAMTVFDVAPGVAGRFAAEFPAQACSSAAEAASAVDFVILMLPSSKEVEATLMGADGAPGLVAAMRPGTVILDMSSSEPQRSKALAERLATAGFAFADAPVSGGVKRARDGSLSIMFGGIVPLLERCRPLLATMGTTIFHVGAVGCGHAMKALNNMVSAAGLVAAVEALHIGSEFGLDPEVMTRVLNASTGKNNTTEHKVAQFMLSGAYNSGFGLALMAKDLGIAIRLAESLGVAAVQGHTTEQLWSSAAAATRGADHTEMYRLLDS